MNTSDALNQPRELPSPWRAAGEMAASGLGALVVGIGLLLQLLFRGFAASDSWIFGLLVTKPLIDLTWHWPFFDFGVQEVNAQTIVGLIALSLNLIFLIQRPWDHRIPRIVLIFLAFASFSVLCTPTAEGFNELLRLLTGATFFYSAGSLLAKEKQFDRFAKVLVVVVSIPVLLSFLQLVGAINYYYWDWIGGGAVGRVSGTYPTPLSLVYLLIYVCPLAFYLSTGKKHSPLTRLWGRVFLVAACMALVFTYHRAGYITVVLQGLLWLYLTRGKKAAGALLIVVGLIVILSLGSLATLYGGGQAITDSGLADDEFLRGRGFQWFLFLSSYASSGPFHWIFGNGGSVIPDLDLNLTYVLSPEEPHSDFIRILHAYGIVGLVGYLTIFGLFIRRTLRLLSCKNEFTRDIGRIMLPVLLAVLLLSITTEPMRYPSGVWYLFALGSTLFCVGDGRGHGSKEMEGAVRA
jgi:O-antigen ligase